MLTIITPTTRKALTTAEAVRDELGEEVPENLLVPLILRASAAIETICGRSFARERVIETSASVMRRGGSIILTRWPVVEIHSITSDGQPLTDYDLDFGILTGVFGRVAVDYTGGYILPGEDDANLPADIERAAIMLVRRDFHDRGRDPSLRSEAVDGLTTLSYFQSTTPSDVASLLDRYRVPVAL